MYAFVTAIVLWLYPGLVEFIFEDKRWGAAWLETHIPEELVGLLAGLSLFFLPGRREDRAPVINWQDAVKIDWSTILLLGFFFVHIIQVIRSGWSNFASMVTGYRLARRDDPEVAPPAAFRTGGNPATDDDVTPGDEGSAS